MLRVTLLKVAIDPVLGVVRVRDGPYLYAQEGLGTDNPHVHFFLRREEKSIPALRVRLTSLGLEGNASYSIKKLKEEYPIEVLAYILKGGTYRTNLPKKLIETALSHDSKVKTDMKDRQKKQASVLGDCVEICKNLCWSGPDELSRCRDVADAIVKYHMERGLTLRRYQLKVVYDTVLTRIPELEVYGRNSLVDDMMRLR